MLNARMLERKVSSLQINPALTDLQCLRCSERHGVADLFEGCPSCLQTGFPSSVAPRYASLPRSLGSKASIGMARYADWLPYSKYISLGEGNTPLVAAAEIGREVGLSDFFIKQEGANPTGSHKDRMSCQVVSRARDVGARSVIAASSGNAGVSLAAYAAAAGLDCEIVATATCNPVFRRAMEFYGAKVVATRELSDRWRYMEKRVKEDGAFSVTNYLSPPVGSNPFGVDGFKTISFEVFEQLGGVPPDAVIAPADRADLLWGLYAGFRDLLEAGIAENMPKLFAVEPYPRLSMVTRGSDYRQSYSGQTSLLSIAGSTTTFQGLLALRQSNGNAVVTPDDEVIADQRYLARRGHYVELSGAAVLTGARRLREAGIIQDGDSVVAICTSSGSKDPIEECKDMLFVSP
jgi:threonine synthase